MVTATPRTRISPAALALFAELEHTQHDRPFDDKARELMRLLGLTAEWWSGCSVLDRSDGPVHSSPNYCEYHDWHRCRAARNELMAALEARGKPRTA